MGSFWRCAVQNQEPNINATLVREYASTIIHENMPQLKQCMCGGCDKFKVEKCFKK